MSLADYAVVDLVNALEQRGYAVAALGPDTFGQVFTEQRALEEVMLDAGLAWVQARQQQLLQDLMERRYG